MHKLVFSIFFSIFSLFGNEKTIAVLYGSGSAGKTSLSREITSKDSDWFFVDEDEQYINQYLIEIPKLFPEEYEILSSAIAKKNLFHAIAQSFVLFNDSTPEHQRIESLKAIKSIRKKIYRDPESDFEEYFLNKFRSATLACMKKALNEGKKILLDRWFLTFNELEEHFPDCKIIKTLVCSPIDSSMEKIQGRNELAIKTTNAYNYRFYIHVIRSFTKLYTPSLLPENALFSYTRSDLETLLDKIYPNIRDFKKEEFLELKDKLIPPSIQPSDTIFFSPTITPDIIIDTKANSPLQAAEIFLNEYHILQNK